MADDQPRELFLQASRAHPDARGDAKRFESLLKDYYQGRYRKEVAVLSNCLREGVPDALTSVHGGAPFAIVSVPLVRRLVDNWGTTEEIARWAVDSWALALGVVGEADLRQGVGSLRIASDPPGAKAIVDGRYVGMTPVEVRSVGAGIHHVECTRDGYAAATRTVTIAEGCDATISLPLGLLTPQPAPAQNTAVFVVNSDPLGAECYLDDQSVGRTPLRISGVQPGSHMIRCVLAGYSDQTVTGSIRALEERHHTLTLSPLTLRFGEISLQSTPAGCAIHLDGTYVGLSPLRMEKVVAGSHTIRCVHAGYEEKERSINVAPGRSYRVNLVLDPILQHVYEVAIASRPSRATLFVNQQKVGQTPYTLTTAQPGSVSVVCTYPGYLTWHEDVTIGPGSPDSLAITLAPEETPAAKSNSAKRMPPLMPRPMAVTGIIYLIVLLSLAMLGAGPTNPILIIFSLWGFVGMYGLYYMKSSGYKTTMSWAAGMAALILLIFIAAPPAGAAFFLFIGLICFATILITLKRYKSYFIE